MRCAGATSARLAPDARVRWPASPASPTPSTPASTTAASGDPPTTAPTGCRCSTTSRPARSAPSPSPRRTPNVIYVGTGAGHHPSRSRHRRRDVQVHRRRATWQHLGLRDSQMIAAIAVDPGNADRLFVAVLGHPYGPNAERGVFRSTDGGRTFEKVLFKDDYTSANEVLLDPAQSQRRLRDALVAAAELHRGPGIRQRRHGHLQVDRRRHDLDAAHRRAAGGRCRRTSRSRRAIRTCSTPRVAPAQGPIGFYKSTDGGAHWFQAIRGPGAPAGLAAGHAAARAHRRRRPADRHRRSQGSERRLQRLDRDVADDGRRAHVERRARRAGRRRLSAHLDQSRSTPNIILVVADQGAVVSANRGRSWSNWYNQTTAAMYHVTTDNAFPYRVCSRPAGLGQRVRAKPIGRRPRSRSTTGIRSTSRNTAWPRPIRRIPTWCTAASATACPATTGAPAQTDAGRARHRRARCPAAAR